MKRAANEAIVRPRLMNQRASTRRSATLAASTSSPTMSARRTGLRPASLRRSRRPIAIEKTNTPTRPVSIAGKTGRNTSLVLTCSADAARAVGPPHGRMFIVPAASAVVQVSVSGSMRNRVYNGSIAGTVIMNVLAPAPSRCAMVAMAAVPTVILTGSALTTRTRRTNNRVEQPRVVHHAEVQHCKRKQARDRHDAPNAVQREGADLPAEPAGEASSDRHERERHQHRGHAEQDQNEENNDRPDTQPGQHADACNSD